MKKQFTKSEQTKIMKEVSKKTDEYYRKNVAETEAKELEKIEKEMDNL